MGRKRHSYLDLTAMPEIGAALVDPRPAWLWDRDGTRILWANAAGAAFFGLTAIEALLERPFSPAHPAARPIARLARSLPSSGPARLEALRFSLGVRVESVAALCTRIALEPDGALLVRASGGATGGRSRDEAARLADALATDDAAVAVLGADGSLLAASDGVADLRGGAATLGALARDLAASGRRSLKRPEAFGHDLRRIGLALAGEAGDRVVLALIATAGDRVEMAEAAGTPPLPAPPAAAAPVSSEAPAPRVEPEGTRPAPPATVPAAPSGTPGPARTAPGEPNPETAAAPAEQPRRDPDTDRPLPLAEEPTLGGVPEGAAVPAMDAAAQPPAAIPAESPAPEAPASGPAEPSRPAASAGEKTTAGGEAPDAQQPSEPSAEAAAPAGGFAFYPRLAPVRFVFQIDAESRFSFVSPEFAAAVGPVAADIVGRTWDEVAAARAIDAAGPVGRALARRDTWSGFTVYWPVDGAALAVAVDLAALPAFGRNRQFEGFRGFGVCRTTDTRPAVAAARTPPAEAAAPPPKRDESGAGAPADASRRPAGPAAAPPAGPSNVVRLPSAGPDAPARIPLSGTEQDAFRRIAEALRAVIPRRPPAGEAEAPPEPAAPQAAGPGAGAVPPDISPAPPARPTGPAFPARVLDRLPLGIVVFRDRTLLFVNKALLDLLGYQSMAEVAASGGIDTLFPADLMLAGEGERAERTVALRRRSGAPVPVEARLNTVPWDESAALMLSFRELPSPPAADPALLDEVRSGRQRIGELEAILDTATDGVVVVDRAARIVSLNRSAEALFGVEAARVLGAPFASLLAEESRKAALDYLDGLAQNGVASVLNDGREVIGRVPAGGLIPLFMTMGPVGGTDKFCAVLRDVSQWKNAEEELVAARRAAEQANSQKSDFLAKISHEIRTPLNAVIGFSEVMLEERFGPIGNERYREYLRDIHLSGSHLLSLINDLLDLSKIEAGKLELAFAAVDVNAVIQECVALMQPQANRERIIIRTSLAAGMPNVVADARSLRQIVLNILSNAVKFTPAGGQVIVSSALEDNGEVVIRIRDTGVGMSAKDLETALKPFRQISTPAHGRFDGTGLGLPLTKALVEANRAGFAIDSAPNQGTLVRITFPTTRVLAG